jgi:hypothetical protein
MKTIMQVKVNNKIYEIRQHKKRNAYDEFELYHANKFVCIFYQDARTMSTAVTTAIEYVELTNLIKDCMLQPRRRKKKKKNGYS